MSFHWLSSFGPGWGIGLVIASYLVLAAVVCLRPAEVLLRGAPDRHRWRDLRWWIALVVAVQIWLHWILR